MDEESRKSYKGSYYCSQNDSSMLPNNRPNASGLQKGIDYENLENTQNYEINIINTPLKSSESEKSKLKVELQSLKNKILEQNKQNYEFEKQIKEIPSKYNALEVKYKELKEKSNNKLKNKIKELEIIRIEFENYKKNREKIENSERISNKTLVNVYQDSINNSSISSVNAKHQKLELCITNSQFFEENADYSISNHNYNEKIKIFEQIKSSNIFTIPATLSDYPNNYYFEQPKGLKSRGLSNYENSCFINSIIQSFFHFDNFFEFFASMNAESELNKSLKNLFVFFHEKLFDQYFNNFINMTRSIGYHDGTQKDAKSFYTFIIDKIRDEDKNIDEVCIFKTIENYEFTGCYFYSHLLNEIYDLKHQGKSEIINAFIPIQCDDLQEGINQYFNTQYNQDKRWCENCNLSKPCKVTVEHNFPSILCIYFHTQLFITLGSTFSIKNLAKYTIQSCIVREQCCADLWHFYAACKESNRVIIYDDEHIKESSTHRFGAYMIFCKKN